MKLSENNKLNNNTKVKNADVNDKNNTHKRSHEKCQPKK